MDPKKVFAHCYKRLERRNDGHTVSIKVTDNITESQFMASWNDARQQAAKILGKPIKCTIKPHLRPKTGKPSGRYYVRFEETSIFNIFIGLDEKGERRYETIGEEDEMDFSQPLSWNLNSSSSDCSSDLPPASSWADQATPEQIQLASVIKFPSIQLTAEQKEDFRRRGKELTEMTPQLEPASSTRPRPNQHGSMLSSSPIPNWVTEAKIREIFRPFSTSFSTFTPNEKTRNKSAKSLPYPVIQFYERNDEKKGQTTRHVKIIYDSKTNDAGMARLMCSTISLTPSTGRPVVITFDYALNNRR